MRLNYLDVLKAYAIIAVVLYHSGYLPFGYLGVDLFLVINGYLITKSLQRKLLCDCGEQGAVIGGYSFRELFNSVFRFELGRVVRLIPALLIVELVCLIVGFFVMLPDDYENLCESTVATNLFSNNILAAITTKNYWDVVNEYKPLMHTWYIGVIMQFYIVYPLLFFMARLDKKNPYRTLRVIVSVISVASLLIFWGTKSPASRFYFLPSRFFELGVGGILALSYSSKDERRPFHDWFVYVCYVVILCLFVFNLKFIPAEIKLVLVVALSVVLVISDSALENSITANRVLAKIGAASYSIFVWHQVYLAFYRYIYSNSFTPITFMLYVLIVAILSWMTFVFIEQKTSAWIKVEKTRFAFYAITFCLLLGITSVAVLVYKRGGVVRDVPELYIAKNEKTDHKLYNDRIYTMDKPFVTDKRHWLVIGNSFGRDFANVILESPISDSVEVSYIYMDSFKDPQYGERFVNADRVFLSSLGVTDEDVRTLESVCISNGFDLEKLVIVGPKNFGECNGQVYAKRNRPDYFSLRVKMETGYEETNSRMKAMYGNHYLDLISMVIDENGTMPAFTPDHHFVSQDCRHFSKGGAIWFGQLIDWERFLR